MNEGELLAWCVVANVLAETTHGEGGEDVQRGLKHFAPGAKVWVLPPQWGDGGESVVVLGRHRGRGRGRLARLVVGRHHLEDFRVRGVYSPAVLRDLRLPLDDRAMRLCESEDEARRTAEWWNRMRAAQSGVRRPQARGRLVELLALLAEARSNLPWAAAELAGVADGVLRDEREAAAVERVLAQLTTGGTAVTAAAEAKALLEKPA
ncbi:hypothetical protein [Amycolatopsis sp. SID8362]|uniref:hypothetical protein n=1 Tax=Amycolatopsis sp. SID8362 TaxID=2690346 RepID=UPI0013700957|nr:hypothetical protein [Amycolatopsis sp. SID8362]NBH07805.1 hypothetical protein [Amycolatopsis sp. SID8362]NED44500.1 hypothetical protein [Amycolatopsis sp. SID8362]